MTTKTRSTEPIGVTGLSIWGGQIVEEYLPQLKAPKSYKIYREMSDDPTINVLLSAIRMPLLAAEFSITPVSEEQADVDSADWLWDCINSMDRYSWRQHVLDMLDMLVYGWAMAEIIWRKLPDGTMGLDMLDPRAPKTLYEWKFDGRQRVETMRQQDPNVGTIYDIPYWRTIHMIWDQRYRSPEGNSLLRACYRPWYFRKNLETIEGIGIERDLAGLPVIKLPFGASANDSTKAAEIVSHLRNDEEAGVVLPPPRQSGKDVQGWELELMSGGSKAYDTRAVIRDYNKQILMTFFAQFLELGMDKVGTQALVQGSHDVFSLALKGVQQLMLECWNTQLVPVLFQMNGWPTDALPTIEWADPGKRDIAGISDVIVNLTQAGIITAEPQLEDHIRAIAGLPDRPEGVGEGPRSIAMPFPQGMGGPQQARMRQYAEAGGIAARPGRRPFTQMVNEYQGELLALYDAWVHGLGEAVDEEKPDSIERLGMLVDSHIVLLGNEMQALGRRRIREAVAHGLHDTEPSPEALRLMADAVEQNDKFITESLLPDVRERTLRDLSKVLWEPVTMASGTHLYADVTGALVLGVLEVLRGRVATYAGAMWAAGFQGAGIWIKDSDAGRSLQGYKPHRVKWQLDPNANHCKKSAYHHGCEQCAGTYDSWSELPTVPAGDVTCLGNCRCQILVEEGGQWLSAVD